MERLVHGSRLRGEARPDSDLDVLVDFIALQQELEALLGVPVDLGEGRALRGPAGDAIRREAEYLASLS